MKTPAIHALIVSAGSGSRFGASTPKQYQMLAGKTVLEQTIARLKHPLIDDLTLVIAKDDTTAKTLPFDCDKPIFFATGGAERFLSVQAGVASIRVHGGCDDDWVLIHDGARPCLGYLELDRLIQKVQPPFDQVGAILAVPVVDTLKFAQDDLIKKTVSREQLYHAQTPQIFRLKALEDMLATIIKDDLIITDEASGFEQLGQAVVVVLGSATNIKLTYPDDLRLATLLVQAV